MTINCGKARILLILDKIIVYLHDQSQKKKKIHAFQRISGKKIFIFQQLVSLKVEKCHYFLQNDCLLMKPNCNILNASATNCKKHAILANFRKHNCILTRLI